MIQEVLIVALIIIMVSYFYIGYRAVQIAKKESIYNLTKSIVPRWRIWVLDLTAILFWLPLLLFRYVNSSPSDK